MTTKETGKQNVISRNERVFSLVSLILQHTDESELYASGEALWLAMQIVCGPDRAAGIVRGALVR
jgi:hypothetical protein